jgi:hypothetical protein
MFTVWILEDQALVLGFWVGVCQRGTHSRRKTRRRREDRRYLTRSRTLQWANNSASDLLISRIFVLNGTSVRNIIDARERTSVFSHHLFYCICRLVRNDRVSKRGKIPLTYNVLKNAASDLLISRIILTVSTSMIIYYIVFF